MERGRDPPGRRRTKIGALSSAPLPPSPAPAEGVKEGKGGKRDGRWPGGVFFFFFGVKAGWGSRQPFQL